MPTPPSPPKNADGSYRPYTPTEKAEFKIRWRGVRDGSTPTLSMEINANRAELTCLVNPTKFNDAIFYFVGAAAVFGVGTGVNITRLLPFRLPGREGLVCTKITKVNGLGFTGEKDANGLPTYEDLEFSLLFETPKYELVSDEDLKDPVRTSGDEIDRYVEPLPNEWTADTISTFGSTLKFHRDPGKSDPTAIPDGIPVNANSVFKTQPKEKFSVVWWRVPFDAISDDSDLWARLQGNGEQYDVPLIGSINKSPIFGRTTGTVQLVGAKRTLCVSPVGDGTKEWMVEYSFETLPSGWNWIWFASTAFPAVNDYYMVSSSGGFATASTVGDRASLYAARDLKTIFAPAVL